MQKQRTSKIDFKNHSAEMHVNMSEIYKLPFIKNSNIYANFDLLENKPTGAYVYGWAFNVLNPNENLKVIVTSGKRVIASGYASEDRPDVVVAGAPVPHIGFKIKIRSNGNEKNIKVLIESEKKLYVLKNMDLEFPLPISLLERDEVIAAFRILFHRNPESEEAIQHQLEVHSSMRSLLIDFFKSTEFHEKNMDIIKILQLKYGKVK